MYFLIYVLMKTPMAMGWQWDMAILVLPPPARGSAGPFAPLLHTHTGLRKKKPTTSQHFIRHFIRPFISPPGLMLIASLE